MFADLIVVFTIGVYVWVQVSFQVLKLKHTERKFLRWSLFSQGQYPGLVGWGIRFGINCGAEVSDAGKCRGGSNMHSRGGYL